jgi:hypothetical protein
MQTKTRDKTRIRPIESADAEACGRAAFEAHRCAAEMNNFPPEHPSVEFSISLISAKLKDPQARLSRQSVLLPCTRVTRAVPGAH